MPALLAEMRADLAQKSLVREFVVHASHGNAFNLPGRTSDSRTTEIIPI